MTATIRSWAKALLVFTAVATVVSVLLRHPIADSGRRQAAVGGSTGDPGRVAFTCSCAFMRGFLQGLGDYRAVGISLVGEQATRLLIGGVLAGVGFGVTGAYIGTPLSFVAMMFYCAGPLRRRLGHGEARRPPGPPAVDARPQCVGRDRRARDDRGPPEHRHHRRQAPFSTDLASSYSATAVAAKVLIWVAMGAGFYLVPEVSRRHAAGEDTPPGAGQGARDRRASRRFRAC